MCLCMYGLAVFRINCHYIVIRPIFNYRRIRDVFQLISFHELWLKVEMLSGFLDFIYTKIEHRFGFLA
jgi:hypothetical protein